MSLVDQEVEAFKRQLLQERPAQVTPAQRDLFNRCYPSGVAAEDLSNAISLCDRTILKNNQEAGVAT